MLNPERIADAIMVARSGVLAADNDNSAECEARRLVLDATKQLRQALAIAMECEQHANTTA